MDNKILEPSCPNCARLKDELKEFKYAVNRWKAEENGWYDQVALLDNENQKLKSKLEMCKETLEFYANKTSYTQISPDFGYSIVKLNSDDYIEGWNNNIGYTTKTGGKRARECLDKLEKE